MIPNQFDLSVDNILQDVVVTHDDHSNVIVVCNELRRWSGSTLSDKSHLLSCLDDNKTQFVQSISLICHVSVVSTS